MVNVPIIHYSVTWWNSLHQAPSVMRLAKPTLPGSMLVPLLMMLLGFTLLFAALLLVRLRAEILVRERSSGWIRQVLAHEGISRHGRLRRLRVARVRGDARGGRTQCLLGAPLLAQARAAARRRLATQEERP